MTETFLAIDDTDSPSGGCTTYLGFLLVYKLSKDFDIIGYPHLVRLNPTIPWKTRGNGAVVVKLSQNGSGNRYPIGKYHGEIVYGWEKGRGEVYLESVKETVEEIIKKESLIYSDNSPGYVITDRRSDGTLYFRGVRDVLDKKEVVDHLNKSGALWGGFKGSRGVIGATCAIEWDEGRYTYELLAYRKREMWGKRRDVCYDEVIRLDKIFPSTFNNYDPENGHICITPNTPCPVLVGIRGTKEEDLLGFYKSLSLEEHQGYLIYKTNQGTDDHLLKAKVKEAVKGGSYLLSLNVLSKPYRGEGGHVFVKGLDKTGMITLAAFRPTGSFRGVIERLLPEDKVVAAGSVDSYPGTLNLEKIAVLEAAPQKIKMSNPICPNCGRRMKSSGKDGYRCPSCGRRVGKDAAEYREVNRDNLLGFYEVSVSARRHLSRPLKLMDEDERKRFLMEAFP